MSSPLRRFEIVLDKANNTFAPGDTVAGQVVVQLFTATKVRGLKICFMGGAEVKWCEPTDYENYNNTTCHAESEEYFRMEYYFLGGAGNSQMVEINQHAHVFRFNFFLPHNIPSSYEHDHGSVRYTINAVMDRPGKYNHWTSKLITVKTPCDLSQEPAAKVPIEDEIIDDICCFPCFKMGTLSVQIYFPSTVYDVGEAIEARIIMNNNSRIDVTKIRLQLKQKTTLRADESAWKYNAIVQTVEQSGPFEKDGDIFVRMIVPDVPPSSFPYCSIIDLQYHLLITMDVSGCHCNIDRKYLILIGTRPATNPERVQSDCTVSLPRNANLLRITGGEPVISPTINYSSAVRASTSMSEQPPPSYDEYMGFKTKN